MHATELPHATTEIDIGAGSKQKPVLERISAASDTGLLIAGSAFIAGSVSLAANQPELATVIFYGAGKLAHGLALAGLSAKLAPVCINASRFAASRIGLLAGTSGTAGKFAVAKDTLKQMTVSAKEFTKEAWSNKVGTGLVLANIGILVAGASYIESTIVSKIPEGVSAVADSFKCLAEGMAFAMHPHLPFGTALAATMHGSREVAEMAEMKHAGEKLHALRLEFLTHLAGIVGRTDPQSRQYALEAIEANRNDKILSKAPVYSEPFMAALRQASIDGKTPKVPDVTTGITAYSLGNRQAYNRELLKVQALGSITDQNNKLELPERTKPKAKSPSIGP